MAGKSHRSRDRDRDDRERNSDRERDLSPDRSKKRWIIIGVATGVLGMATLVIAITLSIDSDPPNQDNSNRDERKQAKADQREPAPARQKVPPAPPKIPDQGEENQPDFERPVADLVKHKVPSTPVNIPDLVAYWSFDEGKGLEATNRKGKTKATLNGARWVKGIRGNAIELSNGATCELPSDDPSLNIDAQSPFTITLWAKATKPDGRLVGFRSSPDGLALLHIFLEQWKPKAWVRQNGGVFLPPTNGGTPQMMNPDEWHHLALSRTRQGQIAFFLDGKLLTRLDAGNEGKGALTTNSRILGWDPVNASGGNPPHFEGAIDEFCMFSRELTGPEIRRLAARD